MMRGIVLTLAAVALFATAPPAGATTNVVPNGAFELGACDGTAIVCGWSSYDVISRVGDAQSGFYLHLACGTFGCFGNGFNPWASISARTEHAFCAPIGPGPHPASFRYELLAGDTVFLSATFFDEPDCTGSAWSDQLTGFGGGGWHQSSGTLLAPPGTRSALFGLGASLPCDDFCSLEANFDDVAVDTDAVPDTVPPDTSIIYGPSGLVNSASATFDFAASERSTFDCSLDTEPYTACTSPAEYSALASGPHTFRVRAADLSGNVDPAPAEQTWEVNVPPAPALTIRCSDLLCDFDGSGSHDVDGTIVSYDWRFGDGATASGPTAHHSYAGGTYTVSLTLVDDRGAVVWEFKTITALPPNRPPAAVFTMSCTALACSFDGRGSADTDGTVATSAWAFGDGVTANGAMAQHTFAQARAYAVTLAVTDDDGAVAVVSKTLFPVVLNATAYKEKSERKVNLVWTGTSGAAFGVFRNGAPIASVSGTTYTDVVARGAQAYVYKVCAAGTSICSDVATVTF